MTNHEEWLNVVAETSISQGALSGMLAFYVGDGEVQVQSFVVGSISHGTQDKVLEAMQKALDEVRKQLASPGN